MLQEPIPELLPWDRNRISAIPLTGPPTHSLPALPTNSISTKPLSRPGVSARLSALTAFSSHTTNYPPPAVQLLVSNTVDQMVDMQNHSPTRGSSQSIAAPRPSSRRALTAALELAQEAVRLDTTNDDPIGAIQAYSRSVALLSEVMERVMRGEETSDSGKDRRRSGRRRSVVAKEEEVRRLKSIVSSFALSSFISRDSPDHQHDTYADRMIILSDIYNVDPFNPDATNSEQAQTADNLYREKQVLEEETDRSTSFDGVELIGSAMLAPSRDSTSTPDSSRTASDHTYTTDNSLPEFEMVHPPSFQYMGLTKPSLPVTHNLVASSSTNLRASILPPPRPPPSGPLPTRPRDGSLSILPPPVAPPRVPPPPLGLPAIVEPTDASRNTLPSASARPRGNSTTHKRTGSDSRLEALQEEPDARPFSQTGLQGATSTAYFRQPHDPAQYARQHPVDEDEYRASITRPPSQYLIMPQTHPPPPPVKDTPPIPPIPTSATPPASNVAMPSSPTLQTSPMTPRGNPLITQPHPFSVQDPPTPVSRARGISTPTFRSDGYSQGSQLIINSNISDGTILQRGSKSSTGTLSSQSSSRSSPPGTAMPSSSGMPSTPLPVVRLTASSLPAITASGLGIGRSRSSSQPPRPLIGANASVSEFGVRPPGPSSQSYNTQGSLPRQPSFPSRFNTALPTSGALATSPAASNPSSYLPSSPFPSASPTDPLRKPYHLMSLLRITMTSKSGGYITRRLHVPHEVWSQGGAKLLNLPEKVRVVEVLCGALEEVQNASNDITASAGVNGATSPGGRKDFERWLAKLDEWNGACEGVVGSVGKKLGVGEGFGAKKSSGVSLLAEFHQSWQFSQYLQVTSWSGKFARSFDRMTNGKKCAFYFHLSRQVTIGLICSLHFTALTLLPVTLLASRSFFCKPNSSMNTLGRFSYHHPHHSTVHSLWISVRR